MALTTLAVGPGSGHYSAESTATRVRPRPAAERFLSTEALLEYLALRLKPDRILLAGIEARRVGRFSDLYAVTRRALRRPPCSITPQPSPDR